VQKPNVLARARRLVVVVTGAAKAAIVARALRAPPSPDLPLSIVCARASDVTWIIGDHAGEMGTHAVTGAWTARVDEVAALPAVTQPF